MTSSEGSSFCQRVTPSSTTDEDSSQGSERYWFATTDTSLYSTYRLSNQMTSSEGSSCCQRVIPSVSVDSSFECSNLSDSSNCDLLAAAIFTHSSIYCSNHVSSYFEFEDNICNSLSDNSSEVATINSADSSMGIHLSNICEILSAEKNFMAALLLYLKYNHKLSLAVTQAILNLIKCTKPSFSVPSSLPACFTVVRKNIFDYKLHIKKESDILYVDLKPQILFIFNKQLGTILQYQKFLVKPTSNSPTRFVK